MRHLIMPLLLGSLLASTGAAVAQPPVVEAAPADAPAPRPATLRLEAPGGGGVREYQLDDLSVSVTRTSDSRGDPRGDVSVSLGTVRPLDTFLLEWARQGEAGPDASRRVVITVPAPNTPDASPEVRYELDGAKVLAFTAAHSTAAGMAQVMLQVVVRRISLNGVVLN